MIWFTSDQHFGESWFLGLTLRGHFDTVEEMNEVMIRNHNEIVAPGDTTYFLGDFHRDNMPLEEIKAIVSRMNGRKVLIMGNHDVYHPFQYEKCGFEYVHTRLIVEGLFLTHDPAIACMDRTKQYLCGHLHGLFRQVGNCIDVGIDAWDMEYVPLEKIEDIRNKDLHIE